MIWDGDSLVVGRSTHSTAWNAIALIGQERSPEPLGQEVRFRLRPAVTSHINKETIFLEIAVTNKLAFGLFGSAYYTNPTTLKGHEQKVKIVKPCPTCEAQDDCN